MHIILGLSIFVEVISCFMLYVFFCPFPFLFFFEILNNITSPPEFQNRWNLARSSNIFNKPLIGNFARLKKKSASEREAFLEEKEIKSPDYRNILKLGASILISVN